jgi:SAM-dependent methyltransferase
MKITISKPAFDFICDYIYKNPRDLFRTDIAKYVVAKERFETSKSSLTTVSSSKSLQGGLEHNLKGLEDFGSVRRVSRLLSALQVVDKIYDNPENLKLLCVGPRTEMELFSALSYGFIPKNIYAIDLIAYGDWIKQGDMHDLKFPDNTFDVVTLGWVLVYSTDPNKVISEAFRVLRQGGYLAIGLTRRTDGIVLHPAQWMPNASEIIETFEKQIGTVITKYDNENYDSNPRSIMILTKK